MIQIIAHTMPIVGQAVHMDGKKLLVINGGARDTYNLKWYRPIVEHPDEIRRHAPDKSQTRDNLRQLATMAKTHRTRDLYTKQYLAEANRAMARKVARVHDDSGIRRMRPDEEFGNEKRPISG